MTNNPLESSQSQSLSAQERPGSRTSAAAQGLTPLGDSSAPSAKRTLENSGPKSVLNPKVDQPSDRSTQGLYRSGPRNDAGSVKAKTKAHRPYSSGALPPVLPMQGSLKCTSFQWANAQKVLPHERLLNPDGRIDIVRIGHSKDLWRDRYHTMLTMPWSLFFLCMSVIYLAANTLFAVGYLLGENAIANAQPGSFADAFFFSVQTMASIGYGAMYPQTLYANLLVTIESLVGLMGIAMVTGLTFARFSRPTTRVMFSNVAVISPYDQVPTLMFRAANQRRNRIIEAQLSMTLVWNEISHEGHAMRRFYDLPLVRSQTPVFALTWTVMHPITPDSPLYGKTNQDLCYADTELVITLTGLDETLSQTVHARHSYGPNDILRNMIFVDLFTHLPDGRFAIDYDRFHQVRPTIPNSNTPGDAEINV